MTRTHVSLLISVLVAALSTACSSPTGTTGMDANGVGDGGGDAGTGDSARGDTGGLDAATTTDTGALDAAPTTDTGPVGDGGSDSNVDASPCDGICASSDATSCPSDCPVCVPSSVASCYTGAPGTMGVGLCTAGTHACLADGSGYGACMGEITPHVDDCATSVDEDCDGVVGACGSTVTASRIGGLGDEHVSDVAAAGGRVVIVGSFSGTTDFGGGALVSAGSTDAFVAVFDAGVFAWAQRFGDAAAQATTTVALDASGGVTVAGVFAGVVDFGGGPLTSAGGNDVFLARFAADGTFLFAQRYGDAAAQNAWGVAVDATGIVLVGDFSGTIDFGTGALTSAGSSDAFVAGLDPMGAGLFSRRYGNALGQRARGVALDPGGDVLVVGSFAGTIDLGGGTLTSAGAADAFYARLDRSGNHLWSHIAGNALEQGASDVAVSSSGDVVVGGSFGGTIDFGGGALTSAGSNDAFVAVLSAAGAHVWSERYGDAAAQDTLGVATDDLGQVFAGGQFAGTIDLGGGALPSAGGTDAFLAALDPAGALRYGSRYGDVMTQSIVALAVDGVSLVIVGNFTGTIDLGLGPLTASGGSDLFVATLRR